MKNSSTGKPGVAPTLAPSLLVWRNDHGVPPGERKAYSEEMREIPGYGGRPEAVLVICDGVNGGGPDAVPAPILEKITEAGRLFFLLRDQPKPELPADAAAATIEDFSPDTGAPAVDCFWTVLVFPNARSASRWRRFLEARASGWVAEVSSKGAYIIKPGVPSAPPMAA